VRERSSGAREKRGREKIVLICGGGMSNLWWDILVILMFGVSKFLDKCVWHE
jgi:hypothetical protein